MITVKELTKRYGAHTAVDALSFTVDKGQIYGLLGPNGAGKSTTMNIITGYISATDGTAEIDGCDIFDSPAEARAKIGYLPEQPPLYTDMTPREYLAFAAELKGLPREQRKAAVEQCMERTNIADVADRLIRNLSKGYRQRVGLACALLGDPPSSFWMNPPSAWTQSRSSRSASSSAPWGRNIPCCCPATSFPR